MFDSLKKIFALFSPAERRQAFWIFAAMLGMALLDVMGVASIMPFMAAVTNSAHLEEHSRTFAVFQALHFTNTRHFLLFLGFGVLGILLMGNSYAIFTTWLITRFACLRQYSLSKRLLTKYLHEPYAFFLSKNTANLSSNILNQVNMVVISSFMPTLQMIAKLIVVTLMLILLCWVNLLLAITSMIFLGGAYSLIYLLARRRLMRVSDACVKNHQELYKITSEAFGGIKDIKLMHCEKTFVDTFAVPAQELAEHTAVAGTLSLVPRYALETIAFSGVLLIVIYFLFTQKNISNVMPILALYAFACFRLMPALQNIFAGLTSIRASQGALEEVYQDLGPYPDKVFPVQNHLEAPLHFKQSFELVDISFAYQAAKETVIKNLNLTIPAKSTIGFVGMTGSGKTTTVDIILGLLRPQQGYLAVDGVRLEDQHLLNWQKKLGYVSQTIYLADDTVARNIAFGMPETDINHAAMVHAAKIANIHDFVLNELPQGYDTLIGERGVRLSGGQRQRLGIARALYHDPDVLILDEATSALDGVTENVVMDAVHSLAHTKTMIIIAHRLTTVRACDTIYLFEKGKIIKSGNYNHLLTEDVFFKEMANLS